MPRTTLVVLASREGDPRDAVDLPVPKADRVLAVDSGLRLAVDLSLRVDAVIGDLDSVDPLLLAQARADGIEIEVHPRDKDHTDLALALERARRDGAESVVVVGGAGGRLDHGLANLAALADPSLAALDVRAILGGATVHVVRDRRVDLDTRHGHVLSLIAIGGEATVTSEGLRWDLHDEPLSPTSTRGVSNELLGDHASVTATTGVILAIQPVPEDPSTPRTVPS